MIRDSGNKTWTGDYLKFKDEGCYSRRSKTHRYSVRSGLTGDDLGDVVWKKEWRRFVYRTPTGGPAYLDKICLTEIAEFANMMTEWRQDKWGSAPKTQNGGGKAVLENGPPPTKHEDKEDVNDNEKSSDESA